MQKQFIITHNEKAIGQVCVTQEGLYYRFSCRCTFPDRSFHRLYLIHSNGMLMLGLLAPEENHFMLNKRIPVKHITAGRWRFVIDAQPERKEQLPILISEDQPCQILPQLHRARFILYNNKPSIVLTDRSAVLQGSDQTP